MTSDLDKLSDAELSEVFAVEVAGIKPATMSIGVPPDPRLSGYMDKGGAFHQGMPPFATSATLVVPFVHHHIQIQRASGAAYWNVWIANIGDVNAPTLARALCIALILSARASMENDRARHRSDEVGHE